jgi:hypothetical protein
MNIHIHVGRASMSNRDQCRRIVRMEQSVFMHSYVARVDTVGVLAVLFFKGQDIVIVRAWSSHKPSPD